MTVAIQIRNVPEPVRDAIAAEAAKRRQSVQAYMLDLVTAQARRVGNAATLDRLDPDRIPLAGAADPARIVREGRDGGFARDRDTL
ncbi:MAG: hypothetical protein LBJ02_01885 [Bifidobacteriaceae bacterium]|jgi:hypothetical protein|nr:hypothetical protein [Bifidobacteriaceae bacterium]